MPKALYSHILMETEKETGTRDSTGQGKVDWKKGNMQMHVKPYAWLCRKKAQIKNMEIKCIILSQTET